jgi:hypothetical protein
MLDIENRRWSLVVGESVELAAFYDNTSNFGNGNLRVAVDLLSTMDFAVVSVADDENRQAGCWISQMAW